ncbi:hypothetical protein [Nonlabens marinus]|uniref:hypothetical protein n=1 Tax=Nonlabens marinus TaxID=930802 RepID=UPI0011DE4BA7|nr:hypothetical protein [Nonlabens marinus]
MTYTQPELFEENILQLLPGTYTAVRPDVPVAMKSEVNSLIEETFKELVGDCYEQTVQIQALEIPLNGSQLFTADVERIKFQAPNLDFLIYVSSSYREPTVTEFRDSRTYRQPREHVTGTLYIFDLNSNTLLFKQRLIGSTEEAYDPYEEEEDDDGIVFKAEGELLTTKVLKRLLKGIARNAKSSNLKCD